MFCASRLIFGCTEGVVSRFDVLRLDSFSAVPWVSGPVFMFCDPRLIFDGTEGVGSLFHVLRARNRFRLYRGRRFLFSCFARSDSISALSSSSGPVFMVCAPVLVFSSIEGVGSRFHVLCARTRFWRYRGRPIPFSCFVRPNSFSMVPKASGPVFMFALPDSFSAVPTPFSCFACSDSFSSVRRASGPFFYVLRARTRFRLYRGRRFPFSCFACPDSFSEVPRTSGPVFKFCAPGLICGGTEGVGSRFHVLRARTHF
jgi:hypothetical protein